MAQDSSWRVVVVGGGQSGLAAGRQLLRAGLQVERDFVILDAGERPGGAWARMWPDLTLFSPAEYSSLPGRAMVTASGDGSATRDDVLDYLADYQRHYGLTVRRPVRVRGVDGVARPGTTASGPLVLRTDDGTYSADQVVNATGTFSAPFVPSWRGASGFPGRQLHSSGYQGPDEFVGRRVMVVGGGNSAAQIVAQLAPVADTRWVTRRPPRFLPADIDGRALFQIATARRRQLDAEGRAVPVDAGDDHAPGSTPTPTPTPTPPPSAETWGRGERRGDVVLGDIVMVEPVAAARRAGHLVAHRRFVRFDGADAVWDEGTRWPADVVIWATGFRPALRHLRGSGLLSADRGAAIDGIRSTIDPRLWFVGYGDWTGPASATLIGVGRTLRQLSVAMD